MKLKASLAAANLALLFLFGTLFSAAQTSRPNFNRAQSYDVQHYTVRTSFNRARRRVFGDTTVRIKPLKSGLTVAELDTADTTFSSVTLEPSGKRLRFRVSGEKIAVNFDKAYGPDDELAIRFKYISSPKKGVYFVDELKENGKLIHSKQIWTQGEPDETHHWLPSFDFPSDKATTEQIITAEKGETVIANGELVEKKENANGTVTFHYRMSVPHSLYLLSFVVGTYVKVEEDYNGIPLGYYVYPGQESIVPQAYGRTKDMMRVFEELTGIKYPYNKYDQTIVASFTFGGMENITATTMSDNDIFLARFELTQAGVEDLVSHELAHSWFGNLVTCKNWAELWLNEGWATFMEAAFREKMYGRRNYMNKIRSDAESFLADDATNPRRKGLFNETAGNVDSLFDRPATTYNKGSAVIHTLREEIGEDAFWKGANLYLTRYRLGNVETTDLIAAMEETSGRDLGWFFDQWVYRGGHPKLDVRHVYDTASGMLKITVTQTQKADKLTPAVFRLPLEIAIESAGEMQTIKLEVNKRMEETAVRLPAAPTKVLIDPNERIPVKTVKITPAARDN